MATGAAAHMLTAFQAVYRDNSSPHLEVHPDGGLVFSSGEQHPYANFAVGLTPALAEGAARKLAAVAAPSLWIVPGPVDGQLEAVIRPFGFEHAGVVPAMSVDLTEAPSLQVPDGFVFERFSSGGDALAWADALAEGYGLPPLAAASVSPLHAKVDDAPDASVQFFQIKFGPEVVGTSALVLADGLAGVYSVAVKPEHRRKGLGAALTAGPLHAARRLGYRKGVLQSSSAGYSVYRALGFTEDGELQSYVRSV